MQTPESIRRGGRRDPHLFGTAMRLWDAIPAGFAIQGAIRRQQGDTEIQVARLQDLLGGLTVDRRDECPVWPPEDTDGR